MKHLAKLFPLLLCVAPAARADVKLPAIFGDHMVLQQGKTIPVWGLADPGERVKVKLGSQSGTAMTEANGHWRIDLKPVKYASTATTLSVSGKNTLTFSDVLVGDVWVASGQSNMEFGAGNADGGKELLASASEPLIRLFYVPRKTALEPQYDVPEAGSAAGPRLPDQYGAHWLLCTPENAAKTGSWNGFSAVGLIFGREIQHFTHQPIGLIQTVWGGTPAEAWTSIDGLRKDPVLAGYVQQHERSVAGYDESAFQAATADWQARATTWDREQKSAYDAAMSEYEQALKASRAAGTPAPPKPVLTPRPPAPRDPAGGNHAPAGLYNAMIAPLLPYAIRGVIWYQGESNGSKGMEYRTLFARMIRDWREHWGEGDFPFLFVQLANYKENYDLVREAQAMTLALPETGMAVAMDVGSHDNIHPIFKAPVGHRLALAAEHVAYGSKAEFAGPMYRSMAVQGAKVTVRLDHAAGLKIAANPVSGAQYQPAPTDALRGFTLAGADKVWHEATARIEGESVVVSSPEVSQPVAVRYGWQPPYPSVNLYNAADLPASPFRSDDWPEH